MTKPARKNQNQDLKKEPITKEQLEKVGTEIPDLGDISPEEAEQIAFLRQSKVKREECAKKIDAILLEYNAVLQIDPRSPHGSPQIIVVLR